MTTRPRFPSSEDVVIFHILENIIVVHLATGFKTVVEVFIRPPVADWLRRTQSATFPFECGSSSATTVFRLSLARSKVSSSSPPPSPGFPYVS